jgi:hypothetical protein
MEPAEVNGGEGFVVRWLEFKEAGKHGGLLGGPPRKGPGLQGGIKARVHAHLSHNSSADDARDPDSVSSDGDGSQDEDSDSDPSSSDGDVSQDGDYKPGSCSSADPHNWLAASS